MLVSHYDDDAGASWGPDRFFSLQGAAPDLGTAASEDNKGGRAFLG